MSTFHFAKLVRSLPPPVRHVDGLSYIGVGLRLSPASRKIWPRKIRFSSQNCSFLS